eukprot:scaffold9243_cov162-Amphora_coffeaeformis.AAC.7
MRSKRIAIVQDFPIRHGGLIFEPHGIIFGQIARGIVGFALVTKIAVHLSRPSELSQQTDAQHTACFANK